MLMTPQIPFLAWTLLCSPSTDDPSAYYEYLLELHNKHLRHNSTESKLWYLPTNLFLPETSPQQMATSLQLFKTLEIIFFKISYTSQQSLSNFCWLFIFRHHSTLFPPLQPLWSKSMVQLFAVTYCDSLSSFSSFYSLPFSSFPCTSLPYPTLPLLFLYLLPFLIVLFSFIPISTHKRQVDYLANLTSCFSAFYSKPFKSFSS